MEITCPQEAMSGVYNCMNLRRGCVFEENQREGTPLVQAGTWEDGGRMGARNFGFKVGVDADLSVFCINFCAENGLWGR